MSTAAKSLLILTLLSAIAALLLPEAPQANAALIICGSMFSLFLLALLAGRKIKFDPVLR
ncbi:PA3371 family protein [Pseudomonas protegens]|uniref:PA3371 family protein n=1 Tax=Pseudomonas TaxID=286 RepID=UPI003207C1A4